MVVNVFITFISFFAETFWSIREIFFRIFQTFSSHNFSLQNIPNNLILIPKPKTMEMSYWTRRHIKSRLRGMTQKKEYNIRDKAKP